MKPKISYNAQKRCARLTDNWGEDDEDSSVRRTDSERKTEGKS